MAASGPPFLSGQGHPNILAEAADAVRHLESGHPRGKIVLTV
ncbi:hypothetical protein ACQP1W_36670 [Spirillospora sp. CA-255316]